MNEQEFSLPTINDDEMIDNNQLDDNFNNNYATSQINDFNQNQLNTSLSFENLPYTNNNIPLYVSPTISDHYDLNIKSQNNKTENEKGSNFVATPLKQENNPIQTQMFYGYNPNDFYYANQYMCSLMNDLYKLQYINPRKFNEIANQIRVEANPPQFIGGVVTDSFSNNNNNNLINNFDASYNINNLNNNINNNIYSNDINSELTDVDEYFHASSSSSSSDNDISMDKNEYNKSINNENKIIKIENNNNSEYAKDILPLNILKSKTRYENLKAEYGNNKHENNRLSFKKRKLMSSRKMKDELTALKSKIIVKKIKTSDIEINKNTNTLKITKKHELSTTSISKIPKLPKIPKISKISKKITKITKKRGRPKGSKNGKKKLDKSKISVSLKNSKNKRNKNKSQYYNIDTNFRAIPRPLYYDKSREGYLVKLVNPDSILVGDRNHEVLRTHVWITKDEYNTNFSSGSVYVNQHTFGVFICKFGCLGRNKKLNKFYQSGHISRHMDDRHFDKNHNFCENK